MARHMKKRPSIPISSHAKRRMAQRTGQSGASGTKAAKRALTYGINHKETSGPLKKYMDAIYLSHGNSSKTRIYGNSIYLFNGAGRLITVLTLPEYLYQNLEQYVEPEAYERYRKFRTMREKRKSEAMEENKRPKYKYASK